MMPRPPKSRILLAVRSDKVKQANQFMVDVFGPLAANTFTVSRKKGREVWYVVCGVFLDDLIEKFNKKIKTEVDGGRMSVWKNKGRKKLDKEGFSVQSRQIEGVPIRR
ncbi:MAG: hypothetical protein GF411_03800 [Candidatus Lokiarchaeota archaeon]|nr:hypothetical protein [Candidatus Lokiarchaeota archaeon]